jgi:hypothetical protein
VAVALLAVAVSGRSVISEPVISQAQDRVDMFQTAEAGGRPRPPWLNGHRYSPHFRVNNRPELLGVEFVSGQDQPEFNAQSKAVVRFLYEPNVSYEALAVGTEFEIVEGPKVVGRGKIIRHEGFTS